MWEDQVEFLERAGYETIAPNLPGREPDNDLRRWAERVLDVVPATFVAVGCSMGGYLAFELWRRAPERMVAAALIDTRAGSDTPEGLEGRRETIRLLREEGFDAFWDAQRPKLFGASASPDLVERARAIAGEQPLENLVATVEALASRADSRETLPEMSVPMLVVVGGEDVITPPAESEAIAASVPDGRLVRIDGAGHLLPLEQPAALNEELHLFVSSVFD
jgi:pimeloyl-ACP methyl ester carboxylesterase